MLDIKKSHTLTYASQPPCEVDAILLQPWAAPNKISPKHPHVSGLLPDPLPLGGIDHSPPFAPIAMGYTSDILLHIFSNISVSSLNTGFLLF